MQTSLIQLKRQIDKGIHGACEKCPMDTKTRKHRQMRKLFGAGSHKPKLVIISESATTKNPTLRSDYDGEQGHFARRDGAIFRLWRLLGEVGILDANGVREAKKIKEPDRRARTINLAIRKAGIYITDLVKCPCENKKEVRIGAKHCSNILLEQLVMFNPSVILTLGKKSYDALRWTKFAEHLVPCHFPLYVDDEEMLNCLKKVAEMVNKEAKEGNDQPNGHSTN